VVIVWLLVYKARHKFTDDDVRKPRQDSLARSRHVVSGKVQENLAPLFPEFLAHFNPRDARFLGTPSTSLSSTVWTKARYAASCSWR
jgi:predicted Holliday junction resolvase-like endonuclease